MEEEWGEGRVGRSGGEYDERILHEILKELKILFNERKRGREGEERERDRQTGRQCVEIRRQPTAFSASMICSGDPPHVGC